MGQQPGSPLLSSHRETGGRAGLESYCSHDDSKTFLQGCQSGLFFFPSRPISIMPWREKLVVQAATKPWQKQLRADDLTGAPNTTDVISMK
jgi:hypothetical protein